MVCDSVVEYILIHYRWVFVCLFLLPISFVYEIWSAIRSFVVFKLNSAPKQHDRKVKNIQKQVQQWRDSGRKTHMCTARPGWQTMSFRQPLYKNKFFNVEVNLVDVLEVDTQKKIVRVEPLVNMGQLSRTLEPLGWSIPVLPEIDDLTVGGMVMGTGIESSSHIYGLFQHICVSYELVLSDGSLVRCSKEENPDLFYAVPWSYGTLGFLTAVEIQIIPAKRYIKLEYEAFNNLDDAVKVIQKEASKPNPSEFIESLVFNLNQAVVMKGNMVDDAEEDKINEIGKWYKPWFFKHVESYLKKTNSGVEYIPLRQYYHRHTRSLFWELQDIIPFGNNPLFRLLLGWMMPPKVSLLKLTQTATIKKLYENNHIIQDMLVPISTLKDSILMFNESVKVYPLWICPFKLPNDPGMVHPPTGETVMYVDIGVYGVPTQKNFKPSETTRAIEAFVAEHKGFQMLYADTYTTKTEFRKMFDHTLYDKMRKELNCTDAFPEVYNKVNKNVRS